eukprot:TRINITY_DN10711_c0_g1_i1.p1 TRINITY_DN10711_c0_g1~~TRINITY_DN10711_c0_g1_i1.p1  ORF type:complete len:986 (+),score=242.09 TRINITY_DN10711_c0_g1_i1:222-3179(+)
MQEEAFRNAPLGLDRATTAAANAAVDSQAVLSAEERGASSPVPAQEDVAKVDVDVVSGEAEEDEGEIEELDIDVMTAGIVEMFRQGQQQEALEAAVAFTHASGNQFGRDHPMYITSLATVAALVDQMGGSEEADMLLLEAETLHEKSLAKQAGIESRIDEEDRDGDGSGDSRREKRNGDGPLRRRRFGGRSQRSEDTMDKDEGAGGQSNKSSDAESDDAVWSDDSSAEDGDVEGSPRKRIGYGSGHEQAQIGVDEDSDDEDDDDEHEAKAITRLTCDVNTLLSEGRPEDAAKLLSEMERLLMEEHVQLSGVSQAALHTLWAGVLDAIGETEKAQCLYDEALYCLQNEVGPINSETDPSDFEMMDDEDEMSEEEAPVNETESEGRGEPKPEHSVARAEKGKAEGASEMSGVAEEAPSAGGSAAANGSKSVAKSVVADRARQTESTSTPTEIEAERAALGAVTTTAPAAETATLPSETTASEPRVAKTPPVGASVGATSVVSSTACSPLKVVASIELGSDSPSAVTKTSKPATVRPLVMPKPKAPTIARGAGVRASPRHSAAAAAAVAAAGSSSAGAAGSVSEVIVGSTLASSSASTASAAVAPAAHAPERAAAAAATAAAAAAAPSSEPVAQTETEPNTTATRTQPLGTKAPLAKQPAAPAAKSTTKLQVGKVAGAASTGPLPKQAAPAGVRIGGGFTGLPQAPKVKAKAKAPRRPKAKAKMVAKAGPEGDGTEVREPVAVAIEEAAASLSRAINELGEETGVEKKAPQSADAQVVEINEAVQCADHFLGMLKFEKAADKLEEQLVGLSDEASPNHGSDLHVDVLVKYGGILWWDGDGEGALDAFEAADDFLADRKDVELSVKRRRADIWTQVAQVYKGCGELELADEQLTRAVKCFVEMASEMRDANNDDGIDDALRDAQASLGQVCVKKKEYSRAEALYISAFSPPSRVDNSNEDTAHPKDTKADKVASAASSSGDAATSEAKE